MNIERTVSDLSIPRIRINHSTSCNRRVDISSTYQSNRFEPFSWEDEGRRRSKGEVLFTLWTESELVTEVSSL